MYIERVVMLFVIARTRHEDPLSWRESEIVRTSCLSCGERHAYNSDSLFG